VQGGTLIEEAELVPLMEERSLVEQLKRGDRTAAATLYRWYGDCLFREVILPRVPIRDLAEDVLRDTFRLILERIDQYTPEENKSIYFWIRRIAINRGLDVYRSWRRARRLEEAIQAEGLQSAVVEPVDPELDREVTRQRIDEALMQINPRYAEALRMRMLEERSREECAERMGVTVGNFDVILHRACAAFRKVYGDEP